MKEGREDEERKRKMRSGERMGKEERERRERGKGEKGGKEVELQLRLAARIICK